MRCLHCGAETSNGLALCDLCQRKAVSCLEFLPIYFRNLARWRPGRAGSRQVPGSRVLWDGTERGIGTGDRISDSCDEVLTALIGWARVLVEDHAFARPLTMVNAVLSDDLSDDVAEHLVDNPAEAAAWMCIGLEFHLVSIATREWCGELVRDLSHQEERLRALTETSVPGWYAGTCRRRRTLEGDLCGTPTYVVPGLTWVTCEGCGTTTYARDHLDNVIDEARDWVAPPMRLAEALVALVDTEMSVPRLHKRIVKWGDRKHIEVVRRVDSDGDPIGPKRYRLGQVLTRLLSEGATRAEPVETQTA
jgi:hypothetical protein